jgi:hypothetical protein
MRIGDHHTTLTHRTRDEHPIMGDHILILTIINQVKVNDRVHNRNFIEEALDPSEHSNLVV